MDLNYNVDTWELSLLRMCSVKVCQIMIEVPSRRRRGRRDEKNFWHPHFTPVVQAEKVDSLKLPSAIRETLKSMLKPIYDGMSDCYPCETSDVSYILTSYGTVDQVKSARAAMQAVKKTKLMYEIACENCLEEHIPEVGRSLLPFSYPNMKPKNRNDRRIFTSLPQFWYELYNGSFEGQIKRKDLTLEQCEVGLELAINDNRYVAIKYFGEKLSQEVCTRVIANYLRRFTLNRLTPATIAFLCLRMSESTRETWMPLFSFGLLSALVDWPYQHLFLEAAKQLAVHLDAMQHWNILLKIVHKAYKRYTDTDYGDLFVEFWKMGANHRHVSFLSDRVGKLAVLNVFLLRDERIIDVVMGDISAEDKENMLMAFYEYWICIQLVKGARYSALESFIRACGMGRRDLLVAFRQYLVIQAPALPCTTCSYCLTELCNEDRWKTCIDKIVKITDKLISETKI